MNQKHRIFVAINLPKNIKKKLSDFQDDFRAMPIKWTNVNNLHITLAFLGYLEDKDLLEISKIVKQVVANQTLFHITLNKTCYGPLKTMPPKMVWAQFENSENFNSLRINLSNLFSNSEIIRFSLDRKKFSPHITLGRVKKMEWRQIEPEDRPEIGQDLNLKFAVDSIEIMESKLKRSGPEYFILESVKFKE
jgi:RNA 2',3'-cyclic 3'-phosphodiesterase